MENAGVENTGAITYGKPLNRKYKFSTFLIKSRSTGCPLVSSFLCVICIRIFNCLRLWRVYKYAIVWTARLCLKLSHIIGLITNTNVVANKPPICKKSCYYWQNNNKQTLFSQKNKDKSNEVTWGFLNIISGWCSIRFTPAFSTAAIYSCFFHSCIFLTCNFARITFSTPAFSVAPDECATAVNTVRRYSHCRVVSALETALEVTTDALFFFLFSFFFSFFRILIPLSNRNLRSLLFPKNKRDRLSK